MPKLKAILEITLVNEDITADTESETIDLDGATYLSAQMVVDVTTPSGASVKFRQSNNGLDWSDLGSATNISADGTVYLERVKPTARYAQLYFAIASGSMDIVSNILVKGLN